MNDKTLKPIIISCLIYFAVLIIFVLYMLKNYYNTTNYFEVKSGSYFCSINVNEDEPSKSGWAVGITKDNIKQNVTEDMENRQHLEKFRETVIGINNSKAGIFLYTATFILILIILAILKKKKVSIEDKKLKYVYYLPMIVIVIFLTCKVTEHSIQLIHQIRDAAYYFYLI